MLDIMDDTKGKTKIEPKNVKKGRNRLSISVPENSTIFSASNIYGSKNKVKKQRKKENKNTDANKQALEFLENINFDGTFTKKKDVNDTKKRHEKGKLSIPSPPSNPEPPVKVKKMPLKEVKIFFYSK